MYIGAQAGGVSANRSYIGQAPGLGQRVPFRFVATAGQTTFSGVDANGYPFGYTPGFVDVFVNGALQPSTAYMAGDGSTLILGTAASAGDVILILAQVPFSPANTYTTTQADTQFNKRRNRHYDSGMRISQEYPTSPAITMVSGVAYWPSDGVQVIRIGSTGGSTAQRLQVQTPAGSVYRLRMTITAANATPAAGDVLAIVFPIEGYEVADLDFGTANAKTILCRVTVRSSLAGTFPLSIRNDVGGTNATRAWIGSITIQPSEVGTDVVKYIVVPGDVAGTWSTTNTVGLVATICLQTGSSFQGTAGTANASSWQNGNLVGLASNTNFMATSSGTFDVMDVGTYDVSGITTPVPPKFELPPFQEDYRACKRYFQKSYRYESLPATPAVNAYADGRTGVVVSAAELYDFGITNFEVEMRTSPSVAGYNPNSGASGTYYDYSSASDNGTISVGAANSKRFKIANISNSWSINHVVVICWTANARMV